jgi:ubiquinol-cytochrome c reductase cytochrome c subunit
MRRTVSRPARLGGVLLLLGVVVVLCLGGVPARAGSGDGSGPPPGTPGPTPPLGSSGSDGRSLYLYSCATCHGQQGQGSQRGPSLVGAGEATVDFYLRTGRMPLPWEHIEGQADRSTPKFDDAQITALDQYVASLGAGGPDIPAVGPGDLGEGRKIYLENCASCHAPSGTGYTQTGGRIAPSLLPDDATELAEAIRVGPNIMPKFPESVLDQGQLDDVVSYVQSLQKNPVKAQGGLPMGEIGAAVEGPVAFGVTALLVVAARLLGKRSARKRSS